MIFVFSLVWGGGDYYVTYFCRPIGSLVMFPLSAEVTVFWGFWMSPDLLLRLSAPTCPMSLTVLAPPSPSRLLVVTSSRSARALAPAWVSTSPWWWWSPSWWRCCPSSPWAPMRVWPWTASPRPTTCPSSPWSCSRRPEGSAWPSCPGSEGAGPRPPPREHVHVPLYRVHMQQGYLHLNVYVDCDMYV